MPAVEEAEAMSLPPLPCMNASELLSKTTDRAFHDVRRLANILSRVNLDARREDLLDYIRLNRARFMRAYVTVRWLSGRHGELVVNGSNALAEAQTQREQIDTVRCNCNSIVQCLEADALSRSPARAQFYTWYHICSTCTIQRRYRQYREYRTTLLPHQTTRAD